MMKEIIEIEELIKEALSQKKEFIPFKTTLKIKSILLSSNNKEMLNYHYSLLKSIRGNNLFYTIRISFIKRPKEIIEPFLLEKLDIERDLSLRADIIELLGNIGSIKVLPYVKGNITSEIRDIRYRCIIVIGWIGGKEELPLLNERLNNEPDDELRGYAATAMRQMWFKQKVASEDILPYLYTAIQTEQSEETLEMIIIVIQDLLKKKFGMQELINDGTIKGDAFKAKEKVLKFINKE